eukprot:m.12319 g.12319  ORF g.12319 m.12319 type:complete len:230 (+) comp3222_c0_seq2:207-896(+)
MLVLLHTDRCRCRCAPQAATELLAARLRSYSSAQKRALRSLSSMQVQELVEKANNPELPKDIEWHFIGHLQSNKAQAVAEIPNLVMIETVHSEKLANRLERFLAEADRTVSVMVQVNTSGEDNKNGVEPEGAAALARHIVDNCPHLKLAGVMTIGQIGRVVGEGETNPDFERLVECRKDVAAQLGIDEGELEMSMGMSGDFEHAIDLGSTNVRVGSTIFGAREYPAKSS